MKSVIYFFLFAFAIILGCSDDGATGAGGGAGGGGGGTGGVTFTVAVVQNQQGEKYFEFKPSTGVIITKIGAQCQALNINDEINDADIPDDVFSSTQPLYVGPITVNLQTGQQWTFNIQGKIGSATGQAYNVNVNFTVP